MSGVVADGPGEPPNHATNQENHHAMTTPAENEATGVETVDVEWRGHNLTLPASLDDADISVMEAFEDGKGVRALRALLGDRQWAALTAAGMKGRDFKELTPVVAKALGFGSEGE